MRSASLAHWRKDERYVRKRSGRSDARTYKTCVLGPLTPSPTHSICGDAAAWRGGTSTLMSVPGGGGSGPWVHVVDLGSSRRPRGAHGSFATFSRADWSAIGGSLRLRAWPAATLTASSTVRPSAAKADMTHRSRRRDGNSGSIATRLCLTGAPCFHGWPVTRCRAHRPGWSTLRKWRRSTGGTRGCRLAFSPKA